ncbi:MAG: TrbG/VirB9 family P-type conjugative transfer protein, partial [Pseudomonadota bacterium]
EYSAINRDNFAWQITPVDRRIFVKPTEENIHTNLTVITNVRTYHFELLAKSPTDEVDYNFAYVVRFFYPTDD